MRVHRIIAALGGAAALLLTAAPAGAQADHGTFHEHIEFSEPSVAPCDPSNTGTLSVQGEAVNHFTDTGRTFQFHSSVHGTFTFDPDAAGLASASGHFVVQHRESVNFAQLKDFRVTDTTHSVAHLPDGTSFPIQIRTTLLFHPDGSFEVKVDSLKCGGQST